MSGKGLKGTVAGLLGTVSGARGTVLPPVQVRQSAPKRGMPGKAKPPHLPAAGFFCSVSH